MPLHTKAGEAFTTHHAAKWVALLLMTLDHYGTFLAPDEPGWRMIGRLCVPIWFFLIGHAPSRSPSRAVIGGAIVATLLLGALGRPVFPLNVLWTLWLCQWLLLRIERREMLEHAPMTLLVATAVAALPTMFITEYGTVGLLFALLGRMQRESAHAGLTAAIYFAGAYVLYIAMSMAMFMFPDPLLGGLMIGLLGVMLGLARFHYRPLEVPLGLALPMRYIAQHSLLYYVLHQAALQWLACERGIMQPVFHWF